MTDKQWFIAELTSNRKVYIEAYDITGEFVSFHGTLSPSVLASEVSQGKIEQVSFDNVLVVFDIDNRTLKVINPTRIERFTKVNEI